MNIIRFSYGEVVIWVLIIKLFDNNGLGYGYCSFSIIHLNLITIISASVTISDQYFGVSATVKSQN